LKKSGLGFGAGEVASVRTAEKGEERKKKKVCKQKMALPWVTETDSSRVETECTQWP
jgi:hypothetical protein